MAILFVAAGCSTDVAGGCPICGRVECEHSDSRLIADSDLRYAVVCPSDASPEALAAASRISAELGKLSRSPVAVEKASSGSDAREIIVGAFAYAPAYDEYEKCTYGSYLLSRIDRKIIVSANDAASYDSVTVYLSEQFKKNFSNGNLSLEASALRGRTVSDVSGYVPPFVTGRSPAHILQCGSNTGKDTAMQVDFSKCEDIDFISYYAALEDAGYTKCCENAFGQCRYVTYSNGRHQVSVSLYKATGLMRIVSEPAYPRPVWDIGKTPGNVQMLMMQVCQDNVRIVPKSHPCAYVIRLSDGRYLLYDTGTDTAAEQLMQYMRSRNTFTDGKVHIAMIIISHPHRDHKDGLKVLASEYASEIECEAVAFNLTNHKRQSYYTPSTLSGFVDEMTGAAASLGAGCYCLRAGQVIDLAGARLEVLFTPDELGTYFLSGVDAEGKSSTDYDQNNSSNMVRLTAGGKKITFTGDCRGGEAGIFNDILLSSFESDIMTAAHHGFNVSATLKMYTKAKPSIIFWPVRQDEQDMTRYFDKELMAATYVKQHFFEETQVEIAL